MNGSTCWLDVHKILTGWCSFLVHKILTGWCSFLVHKILTGWCSFLVHKILTGWCSFLVHKILTGWCSFVSSLTFYSMSLTEKNRGFLFFLQRALKEIINGRLALWVGLWHWNIFFDLKKMALWVVRAVSFFFFT